MQKIYPLFILIVCFLMLLSGAVINSHSYLDKYSGRYEVYLSSNSSSARIVAISKKETCRYVSKRGEAIFISNSNLKVEEIFDSLSAKLNFIEEMENGVSYYGYSDKIKYKKYIRGKTINVHVYKSDGGIKIGLPIIYGSF